MATSSAVLAQGAKIRKLTGGFHNISGGAVGPAGEFYFVDAHWQRVWRWDPRSEQLSSVSDFPLSPTNLAVDQAGNLLVISSAGKGVVYSLSQNGTVALAASERVAERTGPRLFLPVSDWRVNRPALSHPAAHFVSVDGKVILPAGADFLEGALSWGVKSSPQIRSFGLARAIPGQPFFVSEEATLTTWVTDVASDGSLFNFRLFAEQGSEGVAVDSQGNVFLAAGDIYVYDSTGKLLETIGLPERPLQLVFGGADGQTLFIPARTSLYAVQTRYPGR